MHFNKYAEKLFFDPKYSKAQKFWKMTNGFPANAQMRATKSNRYRMEHSNTLQLGGNVKGTLSPNAQINARN